VRLSRLEVIGIVLGSASAGSALPVAAEYIWSLPRWLTMLASCVLSYQCAKIVMLYVMRRRR
jgi:hypothetical protein